MDILIYRLFKTYFLSYLGPPEMVLHINFQTHLLTIHSPVASKYKDPRRRRAFFDKLAQLAGFDPLDASKWYKVSSLNITRRNVCMLVVLFIEPFMIIVSGLICIKLLILLVWQSCFGIPWRVSCEGDYGSLSRN
jgi:hypothetical protein